MNDRGDVLELASEDAARVEDEVYKSVLYAPERVYELAIPWRSIPTRVSNQRVVVGLMESEGGATHAFRFLLAEQRLEDLGTLGGENSAAFDVNSRGHVVGVADTTSGERHGFLFRDGALIDLGTLGGNRSDARGIDDDLNVVGNSVGADGLSHPFVYRDGTVTDLTPKVHGEPSYRLVRVEGISNGVAVGWGQSFDGAIRCLIWRVSHEHS